MAGFFFVQFDLDLMDYRLPPRFNYLRITKKITEI
jgi:hypothetical protein